MKARVPFWHTSIEASRLQFGIAKVAYNCPNRFFGMEFTF
jgi:hypothetical protein